MASKAPGQSQNLEGTPMSHNRTPGQGVAEYALLLALITVVVVVILTILGPAVASLYAETVDEIETIPLATGTPAATATLEPTPTPDWAFCANENAYCSFSGEKEVRYGANGTYVYRTFTDGTQCSNAIFGDPIYGTVKLCSVR
jgi:Flp pilus assembly pilin Flp